MTTLKRTSLVALLVTSLAALAGPAHAAADPQPVKPFVPGINEDPALTAAWQQWQATGIDDYVITVRISCFCVRTAPVRTVVRDDATVRVTQGDRRLRPGRGYSMDEVFTRIREARATADDVQVDYTRRGVPSSIVIDRIADATDDELYWSVSVSRL